MKIKMPVFLMACGFLAGTSVDAQTLIPSKDTQLAHYREIFQKTVVQPLSKSLLADGYKLGKVYWNGFHFETPTLGIDKNLDDVVGSTDEFEASTKFTGYAVKIADTTKSITLSGQYAVLVTNNFQQDDPGDAYRKSSGPFRFRNSSYKVKKISASTDETEKTLLFVCPDCQGGGGD
jgi:hypothetical protein